MSNNAIIYLAVFILAYAGVVFSIKLTLAEALENPEFQNLLELIEASDEESDVNESKLHPLSSKSLTDNLGLLGLVNDESYPYQATTQAMTIDPRLAPIAPIIQISPIAQISPIIQPQQPAQSASQPQNTFVQNINSNKMSKKPNKEVKFFPAPYQPNYPDSYQPSYSYQPNYPDPYNPSYPDPYQPSRSSSYEPSYPDPYQPTRSASYEASYRDQYKSNRSPSYEPNYPDPYKLDRSPSYHPNKFEALYHTSFRAPLKTIRPDASYDNQPAPSYSRPLSASKKPKQKVENDAELESMLLSVLREIEQPSKTDVDNSDLEESLSLLESLLKQTQADKTSKTETKPTKVKQNDSKKQPPKKNDQLPNLKEINELLNIALPAPKQPPKKEQNDKSSLLKSTVKKNQSTTRQSLDDDGRDEPQKPSLNNQKNVQQLLVNDEKSTAKKSIVKSNLNNNRPKISSNSIVQSNEIKNDTTRVQMKVPNQQTPFVKDRPKIYASNTTRQSDEGLNSTKIENSTPNLSKVENIRQFDNSSVVSIQVNQTEMASMSNQPQQTNVQVNLANNENSRVEFKNDESLQVEDEETPVLTQEELRLLLEP